MPITTQCPHCQKAYILKDALAGRKVTCANANCRQTFVARPQEEVAAETQVAAEKLAMEAFNEEPVSTGPEVAEKQIPMKCNICDHTWTEPWSKQGKNTLCPDCRTRQRIPIQKENKPADWRDPNARGPSMAKQEKLEGVIASGDTIKVSGETLRKTGVVTVELEPRPRWHYAAVVVLPLALISVVVFGIFAYMYSAKQGKLAGQMDEAITAIDAEGEVPYPDNQHPLFKAEIYIAAGEFEARNATDDDGLNAALERFSQAHQLLASVPRSPSRDLLIGDLAMAMFSLVGNDLQVSEGSRIPWKPIRAGGGARARMSGKNYSLQQELDSVLGLLTDSNRPSPANVRLELGRRLTDKLVKAGEGSLADIMMSRVFQMDDGLINATAWILAESLHAGAKPDEVRASVEQLITQLNKQPDPVVFALSKVLDPPIEKVEGPPAPTGNGPIKAETRDAYTLIHLLKNEYPEALEVAGRQGPIEDRLNCLALIAEWSADPGPALEVAQMMVSKAPASVALPTFPMVRLARQAGRGGNAEALATFLKATDSPGYQAWALAASVEGQSQAKPDAIGIDTVALPDDPKGYQAGHAVARLTMARHNAKVTGTSSPYTDWNSLRPFGLAGEALGLQDRERE